ncbi:MAG: dihydrofolate reductase family protein, partial [Proteobacteria bacterium]|nr:dihydrofolate reductase family protein [Pseudomonadota bacterium]
DQARRLTEAGAQVLRLPADDQGRVDLTALMDDLGARGVTSLLAEGGAGLAWSLLKGGLVDEVMYFFAPKLVGGATAPGMVGGSGLERMDQAWQLCRPVVRRFGDDVMLWAKTLGSA